MLNANSISSQQIQRTEWAFFWNREVPVVTDSGKTVRPRGLQSFDSPSNPPFLLLKSSYVLNVCIGRGKKRTHTCMMLIYSFIICRGSVLKCCVWIRYSLQDSCQGSRRILISHRGETEAVLSLRQGRGNSCIFEEFSLVHWSITSLSGLCYDNWA